MDLLPRPELGCIVDNSNSGLWSTASVVRTIRPMEEEQRRALGARFSAARLARGMTQEALAEAVGRSATGIAKVESGTSVPQLDTILRVVEVLNVSLETLLDITPASTDQIRREATLLKKFRMLSDEDAELAVAAVDALVHFRNRRPR